MNDTATMARTRTAPPEPGTTGRPDHGDSSGISDLLFARNLGCLRLAKERGSVSAAALLLSDAQFRARAVAIPAARTFVAQAEQWLSDARAFEDKNGPGTKLDPAHPLNVQLQRMVPVLAARKEAFRRLRELEHQSPSPARA